MGKYKAKQLRNIEGGDKKWYILKRNWFWWSYCAGPFEGKGTAEKGAERLNKKL